MTLIRPFKKLQQVLGRQLSYPTGLLGRLVGLVMNVSNKAMYTRTLPLLDVQPQDHILEIGFGNGKYLKIVARQVPQRLVAGVDISNTMLQLAQRHNRAEINQKRIVLHQAPAHQIPYPDAFLINLYFR
ncbi:MAG: class I SAM-dependent methyltransferase [Bacteroidia bacterium]|nr:class I SAM-dependent methyltransferase [Bacteroidia bacterium]